MTIKKSEIAVDFPAGFFMQKHRPEVMSSTHAHGHVEILLPDGCELTYATQSGEAIAPEGRLSVLWGQMPHRLTKVCGHGNILIANLPLAELLSWSMPETFLALLFTGNLVTSGQADLLDTGQFNRWYEDYHSQDLQLTQVSLMELQLRLRRQSIKGWIASDEKLMENPHKHRNRSESVQLMIRFLAENYTQPLTILDVAQAGGISKGYAMSLFHKHLGVRINHYITTLRLHHAKAALSDSNDKILTIAYDAGFGSLSRFYEIFMEDTGMSPRAFRLHHRTIPS